MTMARRKNKSTEAAQQPRFRTLTSALAAITLAITTLGLASPAHAAPPSALEISGTGTNTMTITFSGGSFGANYLIFCDEATNPCIIENNVNYVAIAPVATGESYTLPYAQLTIGSGFLMPGNYNVVIRNPGALYSNTVSICLGVEFCAPSNTVTFNANGGTGSMDNQESGSSANLSANTFTRDGYEFTGWNTEEDGTGDSYDDLESFDFAADETLYAQWVQSTFTVTFNANGGTGSMDDQVQAEATNLDASDFTRSGYMFYGWNTEEDGTGDSFDDESSFPFEEDTTLYAKWKAIPSKPTSDLAFDIAKGEPIASAPVDVVVEGLKDQSQFKITVRSTPIVVAEGRIFNSRLDTYITVPTGLEPGWHSITIDAVAADGTPWSDVMYFEVTASGKLADVTAIKSKTDIPATAAELKMIPKSITKPKLKFASGSSKLSSSDKLVLRKVAKYAKRYNFKVTVTGIAGMKGSAPRSAVKLLAKKRASLIKKYLIKQGVKAKFINVKLDIEPVGSKVRSRVKLKIG